MSKANENIPAQHQGQQIDIVETIDAITPEAAHHLFLAAKSRLKDVSLWHNFAGPLSANFTITDSAGNEVYKFAEVGDIIRIDLPGPGPTAGDGFDWVRIEALNDVTDESAENEYAALTLRPIANPKNPGKAIAHFYGHAATSTLIVERELNRVSAAMHGRNEVVNTEDTGLFDTVRNSIIALSAREGISIPQWKALIKGLLGK